MANPEHLDWVLQGGPPWDALNKAHGFSVQLDLRGADLSGRILRGVALYKADLSDAKLASCDLSDAFLNSANLRGANLEAAKLIGAKLIHADLRNANLANARLIKADLTHAILIRANLAEAHLHEAVLEKADLFAAYCPATKFVNAKLSGANLRQAHLFGADLTGAKLMEADLSFANLVESVLDGADLTGANIYGISAWGVKLNDIKQSGLRIAPPVGPVITVDDLEVAQFIYMLLNNEKVRHVIDTITSKVVLILGRFTEERKAVLDSLRNELRKRDYVPVLFDFEHGPERTTVETIVTLAHMCKFVIADITDAKSVLQELQAIVPDNPSVPVQPLLLASQEEPGMFDHFRRYPWVLNTHRYKDMDELLGSLDEKVIDPAEKARQSR